MNEYIENIIKDNNGAREYVRSQSSALAQAAEKIHNSFQEGNKLLIFGNGGSAADAQHIAAELTGRFKVERKGLSAIALTTDTSLITAFGNDYADGFERIFERQVQAHAVKGDLLWGISTSGNSENVLRGFQEGEKIGTYNISLTGRDGGKLKLLSDLNINIPLDNTARIQEAHLLSYHIICELVDNFYK